jgi:hypothetical protein
MGSSDPNGRKGKARDEAAKSMGGVMVFSVERVRIVCDMGLIRAAKWCAAHRMCCAANLKEKSGLSIASHFGGL